MLTNKSKKHSIANNAGMTLIEILIVLVIIGGIAGVLITNVMGSLDKANRNQAIILLNTVQQALDQYRVDCFKYPSESSGLDALMDDDGSCKNWGPSKYLKQKPRDPWSNELVYYNDNGDVELISLGGDRKEGGKGVNKDLSTKDSDED